MANEQSPYDLCKVYYKKKLHHVQKLQKSYNWGGEENVCDVCFTVEKLSRPIKESNPFIKCTKCCLLVHALCYSPITHVDTKGHFLCDVCYTYEDHLRKQANGSRSKSLGTKNESINIQESCIVISSDDSENEDKIEFRKYENMDSFDIRCMLCLRNDVAGGMKMIREKKVSRSSISTKWAHLSCTLSTYHAFFENGFIQGVCETLERNRQQNYEEWENEPICEVCLSSGGFLMPCVHISRTKPDEKCTPVKSVTVDPPEDDSSNDDDSSWRKNVSFNFMDLRCHSFVHPLCAELSEYKRVIDQTENGDVVLYHCAEHSDFEKCMACDKATDQRSMVECDGCKLGCHLSCMTPPLSTVPKDDWFCHKCSSSIVLEKR